jgi:hypothetical protein
LTKAGITKYFLLHTFLSRILQTEKSIGFKSGEEGGYIVLSKNWSKYFFSLYFFLSLCTILLEAVPILPILLLDPWEDLGGQEVKITSEITVAPSGITIRGVLHASSLTPPQTMIWVGCWQTKTVLGFIGMS